MADRPHENLSDEELYRTHRAANDKYVDDCLKCGGGHFSRDVEINRWRCTVCGEPHSDEQVKCRDIALAYHDEIGWRSVYMQDGDESSWIERQEAHQRIAELQELEQSAAGGEEQG